MYSLSTVTALARALVHIPGIGYRTAGRYALELSSVPAQQRRELLEALQHMDEAIRSCVRCYAVAEAELCPICLSSARDQSLLCIVETFGDLVAIEQTGSYRGIYHVLGGRVSPVEQCSFLDLNVSVLGDRLKGETVERVIVGSARTPESEITASMLFDFVQSIKSNTSVVFLNQYLPPGASPAFAASHVLKDAIEQAKNAVDL
ncbi:toprim domain-containing protein [Desulfurispira natronophila]|uniref:Recombination protein RecR n=1 Tax=Desulfurispira natronophila TaxID=682562 RepID=A0A7W8DH76_9BACT|nr:toprim domain-containing protein [Desulfurispira natronophila]MBB5022276.1 recombination protein RecR [Desulfurispira natronophila]